MKAAASFVLAAAFICAPSMNAVLRVQVPSRGVGWKNYFRLADTPRVFSDLDQWIRHPVRAIHIEHWKRGTTIYRELVKRGMRPDGPYGDRRIAGNGRRWWRNSGMAINIAFPIVHFDSLGLPSLAATSTC